MKALVTGADGMLGVDLCARLNEQRHTVLATDRREMDVRQIHIVRRAFRSGAPDIVFHLAALTDVDACERDSVAAFRTNAIGTQNVALACQAANIPMVYVSTIGVFDGNKCKAYDEFDTPNPRNVYSRSKYAGEEIVRRLLHRYYIVRAGWMFGGGRRDKKFVAKIVELARAQAELRVVADKFGSPTYTVDFSRAVIRLAQTGYFGLYHLVNTGLPCSRFDFARHILEYAGFANSLMAVTSGFFPQLAPRPRMEAARNLHAELMGLDLMRHWKSALREYIEGEPCYSQSSLDATAGR